MQYVDLPFMIPDGQATDSLTKLLQALLEDSKATLMSRQPAWIDKHRGLHFVAQFPGSKEERPGTAKGDCILVERRVFFVYAYVPLEDAGDADVTQFVKSMDVR